MVVGLDTLQGLQAARILAGRGIPVIAIARDEQHPACHTRVCERIICADTQSEELIRTLAAIGPTLPARAVLYPCHDHAVTLISRQREQLREWYHVILPEPDTVELLMEKTRFYGFAAQHGFRVPAMFLLHNRAEAEAAAQKLRFPCILKPSRRSAAWNARTNSKAYRVTSIGDFLARYDEVCGWAPVLLVQDWIEGTDADLYSCNCYFDQRGSPVTTFVARKLRQWPPHMGSSCLGEEVRNDLVRDETLRLFRLTGYRGLGYVEMKRDSRTGEHYMIEANVGRPTGRSAIAEAGGVELLYAMYCDALGLPLPMGLEQQYLGVKWLDLRHDLQSALYYWRQSELTFRSWWRSVRGRKAHAVFAWSDPQPFLQDLRRAWGLALSRTKHPGRVADGKDAA
jgi:predicted ATP-grasp superfamily ATP-dependent carboligase